MGLWSDLPGELLMKFEGYLTLHVDKVRIRAVCQSWNSYLPKMMMPDKLPSLLGVFENQNKSVSLFNLIEQKHDTLYIPEMQGKLFIGSSYGWVAMIEDILDDDDDNESDDDDGDDDEDEDIPRPTFPRSSPDIYLINPFTGVQIRLPPRYTFPDVKEYCADKVGREYALIGSRNIRFMDSNVVHKNLLRKIVMSSSPLQEGCIVVAIYGELGALAWCKCNDNSWTPVGNTEFLFPHLPYKDAIFHKNRLHALRLTGELVVIENIGTNQKVVETMVGYEPLPLRPFCPYLAESSDGEELLMVVHLHNDDGEHGGFVGFDVYKLNAETCSWYKIDNIGDDVLFLGRHSSSLSINAHNVPGFKGNRIYFANESYGYDPSDDEQRGGSLLATKVGVYNLADRTVESLSGFESVFKLRWPVPIWVTSPN